jgi:hypothetical protein
MGVVSLSRGSLKCWLAKPIDGDKASTEDSSWGG